MTMSDRAAFRNRTSVTRTEWREDYQMPPKAVSRTFKAKPGKGAEARRQRAFHSAKDYETSASQLGDIEPTEAIAKRKASVAVADYFLRNDIEPEGIVEVLQMLGIHPDQPDWSDGPTIGPRAFNSETL